MKRLILLLSTIFLLAACGADTSINTLEANYALAGTQVADLRITASVQAARAQTTLDFMQTRAAFAAIQGSLLESTLAADGTGEPFLQTQRAIVLGSSPTPSMTPIAVAESTEEMNLVSATPILETHTPTLPVVIPIVPSATVGPTLPPDPNALRLENPVTALAPGNDGCGTNITSLFTVNTQEIYVIVRAYNLKADGTTFSARWAYEGQPIGPVYDYTPNRDYEELCIWFYVDPTDFDFLVGNYTVVIDIDGIPAIPPIPFTISQ